MKVCKITCLFCSKEFEADYRKKFCNHTCAGSYHAKKTAKPDACCIKCGKSFLLKKKSAGGFVPRKICIPCSSEEELLNQTKGSLYSRRKNWQSANSSLRHHARKIYLASDKPKVCFCGYEKHIEVCHIKAIKDFSDDTKVLEINSIDNLRALCCNHHWEFDNGVLCLSSKQ